MRMPELHRQLLRHECHQEHRCNDPEPLPSRVEYGMPDSQQSQEKIESIEDGDVSGYVVDTVHIHHLDLSIFLAPYYYYILWEVPHNPAEQQKFFSVDGNNIIP
jgi:hypothetical protein